MRLVLVLGIAAIGIAALAFPALVPGAVASDTIVEQFDFIDALADPSVLDGQPVISLEVKGYSTTREFVIFREIDTREGEPFSHRTMLEDVIRLENLDIFSSIRTAVEDTGDGARVLFVVREMPWIVPTLRIDYTELDGWSFGAGAASVNLLGRAIYASGSFAVGGNTVFDLHTVYPWITGNHVSADFAAAHLVRDDTLNEFKETSTEITPWVGTYVGRNGRARAMAGWFQMRSDVDGRTLSPDNVDNLVRLGVGIGYDSRDSWRNPHRGWENEFRAIRTGGWLGGDGDWWLTELDLRRFQPIARKHTLLLGSLASLQSGQVGTDVPGYLMYRIGGANSVRGYDIDVLGRQIFGKNQLIVTAEYQYLVMPIREITFIRWPFSLGLEVAAFSDSGTAWNDHGELGWDRLRSGYGIGLRILAPGVNEIRVDVALSQFGDFQFHFGAWPKFVAQTKRLR